MKKGSSPLTRGKHTFGQCPLLYLGLIPAHAGKTTWTSSVSWRRRAHPRSRGENVVDRKPQMSMTGSSPLTRGKLHAVGGELSRDGLIPAHAGKTARQGRASRSPRAHPRSRGENLATTDLTELQMGSSPLTRGKRFLTCAFIAQIDQILESLELCASSGSYSLMDAYATDAPQDRVRSIGLAPLSSRGAS